MEILETVEHTVGKIICCLCGVTIEPNPTNRCPRCIASAIDLVKDIEKTAVLYRCPKCMLYMVPNSLWMDAPFESREMMTLCLKKIRGLHNRDIKIEDTKFIWTEEHSKRIKIEITVSKDLGDDIIANQSCIVEILIKSYMCSDCHRTEAKDYWNAKVQIRQKSSYKRTFYYLEQLLLKQNFHRQANSFKVVPGGIDFHFGTDSAARSLVHYLMGVLPCRYTESKKLKSHDTHSNTYHYKRTYAVEIVPLSKDSVVCLPKKLAHDLGHMNQLCIISKVSNNISLIDPQTAQIAELSSEIFWKHPFSEICTSKTLTEYIVMEIEEKTYFEKQKEEKDKKNRIKGPVSKRHRVDHVWVRKVADIAEDKDVSAISHLGKFIHEGDSVLGVDLANINVNDANFEKLNDDSIPEVILVKKLDTNKASRNRKRKWRLKHLDTVDTSSQATDGQNRALQDFMDDLEEDENMRENIDLYMRDDVSSCPELVQELGLLKL